MKIERRVRVVFAQSLSSTRAMVSYTAEQNVASAALLQRIGFKINYDWKFVSKHLSQPTLPEQPA